MQITFALPWMVEIVFSHLGINNNIHQWCRLFSIAHDWCNFFLIAHACGDSF
jgi:hypothetical protein